MEDVALKKFIIDKTIKFLQSGKYVYCTDKYMGSYLDGEKSEDRYKISKDNIVFVNMPDIKTVSGKELNLKKLMFDIEVFGEKKFYPVWVAIDIDDWKIYMKL